MIAARYDQRLLPPTAEDIIDEPDVSQFGIDRLDAQQRVKLIGLIWNSLPGDASYTPPDWHIQELERRIAAADANPGAAESREAVLARLE